MVYEPRDIEQLKEPRLGRLNPGPRGLASGRFFLVNAVSDLVRKHIVLEANDPGLPTV